MRDYILVIVIVVSLPIGIFRPFYGLLFYTWASFMYPQMLAWSFAQSIPVAKLAVISFVAGLLLNRNGDTATLSKRETVTLIVLWGTFTLSSMFALYPEPAWDKWLDESKVIAMAIFSSAFITNRDRMRYFLLVIALSLGFFGLKGGAFSIVTGGQNRVYGPGASILGANNGIGLALNMALPLLWYLGRQERGYLKLILNSMFFLSIPAIMFTYSRASVLALGVLLPLMCFRKRGVVLIPIITIMALAAFPYIPERWWDREKTTVEYEQDDSALARIDIWKVSWRLALDRPTGGGFEYHSAETFQRYFPEVWEKWGRDYNTHNAMLGILTAHGIPGLAAYLMMIGLSVLTCRSVKRSVRARSDLKWVTDWCDMVQLSFVAFLINGMFVNMEYFDLVYDLPAIAVALKVIASRELSAFQDDYLTISAEPAGALS